MNGVPSQAVNRLRLFLLAVACWFCLVPTAHAIRPPTVAEELQLKEKSAPPEPSAYYSVCVRNGEVRIGLFVRNNPLRYVDSWGLEEAADDSDITSEEERDTEIFDRLDRGGHETAQEQSEDLWRQEAAARARGQDPNQSYIGPRPEDVKPPCPPKTPFVIGRNMNDRVIPFANNYGFDYYKPGPSLGSEEADLEANRIAIQNVIDSGRPIIDIGLDPANPNPSIYYNMESQLVSENSVPVIGFYGFQTK